jgi:hypothetical protein
MARYSPIMGPPRAYRAMGYDWVIYTTWLRRGIAENTVHGPGVLIAVMESIDAAAAIWCDYLEE